MSQQKNVLEKRIEHLISLKELSCFDIQDIMKTYKEIHNEEITEEETLETMIEIYSKQFYKSIIENNDKYSGIC